MPRDFHWWQANICSGDGSVPPGNGLQYETMLTKIHDAV